MAPHGKELPRKFKRMIITLHEDGQSGREIGRQLKISHTTVSALLRRHKKSGTVENRHRSGRPVKMTDRTMRHLHQLVSKNRKASATRLAEEVSGVIGQPVSAQTVRRALNNMQLHGRRPRRKPLLKKRHKTARLQFAMKHQHESEAYWGKILWSDETKINLFGSDGIQRIWRRVGKDYHKDCVVPTVKHGGGSVLVWGCMSASGVGELPFIDGTMNAQMYTGILEKYMLPSLKKLGRGAKFMQDNDPKHSARLTKEFLRKKKVTSIDWPSMSPDLNPLEHLWGVLNRKVEVCNPSNRNQLKQVIQDEWNKISPDVCCHLMSSMLRRVKAVIDNKGGHTKY